MRLSTLFRNIGFGFYMYWDLRTIRGYKKEIHRLRALGDLEGEREQIRLAETTWGRHLIHKVGAEIRITGKENLPKSGTFVIVANHQSHADIAVLTQTISNRQFGFVAKENLQKLPLFGEWIYDVRSVFMKREDPRSALRTIEEGIELLKQGFCLGIFPEGKRSQGPQMREFKRGSLRLATKPGIPVLPITISGTYCCFEEQGTPIGASVDVHIHPLILTEGMGKKEASGLAEAVEEQIRTKLLELQDQEKNRK